MLQRFLESLHHSHHPKPDQLYLLAVSGGIDSVVMAHLFHKAGIAFAIAHCNFQLRGQESDQDQAFVREVANQYQVPYYTTAFATQKIQENSGKSIQMVARELRYGWFEELLNNNEKQVLCTAHHLNDNVETVLLNLVRGTTVKGLTGILPVDHRLLRPLLFATKEEIHAYAEQEGLRWREDGSNTLNKYKRNRIRNEVINQLEELNPSFLQTFRNNIERWKLLAQHVTTEVERINEAFRNGDGWQIQQAYYAQPANQFIFLEWLKEKGFAENVFHELLNVTLTGKQWSSNNYTAVFDRNALIIFQKKEHIQVDERIEKNQQEVGFSGGALKLSVIPTPASLAQPSEVVLLNRKRLTFPLVLRTWQLGDKFQPFGMAGTKKVSDFLVDQKIPIHEKSHVLVLLSGDEICWVVGMRVDGRFKVGEGDKEVLKITVVHN